MRPVQADIPLMSSGPPPPPPPPPPPHTHTFSQAATSWGWVRKWKKSDVVAAFCGRAGRHGGQGVGVGQGG